MVSHSPISSKVYKSASFSPSSRMKIYQNEARLSSLLNGLLILDDALINSLPILSPCSKIVRAKAIIIRAKEDEIAGNLPQALQQYENGRLDE